MPSRHLLCFAPGLLLALGTHAQHRLKVGPHAGFALSTQRYSSSTGPQPGYRGGLEAGIQASYGTGHWSGQAAALYSQQGAKTANAAVNYLTGTNLPINSGFTYATRLHYLALPVGAAYAPRADGQGLQLVAGAYLACLLGGTYQLDAPAGLAGASGAITPVNGYAPAAGGVYVQRVDAGLRGGLGYRCGEVLVQASYSRGLVNAEAQPNAQPYYQAGGQFALTYFLPPTRSRAHEKRPGTPGVRFPTR